MADDSRDDADNEITRIVRRPGPASLPVNVPRPPGPSTSSSTVVRPDAGMPPPPSIPAAGESAPPVAPPGVFDRGRPVLAPPPPRPVAPPMGVATVSAIPPNAPAPIAFRPAPTATPTPAPVVDRITPAPLPVEPAPLAPALVLTPPAAQAPLPVAAPIPAAVWAEEPKVADPAAPITVAGVPIVAPVEPLKPVEIDPVVGWLVVVKGPGRGVAREVVSGRNGIGSGVGQAVRLDFGDLAIAQQGHAYVVYDDEAREFFAEDGKQKIVVRLNGRLLTETMPIRHGDELRIGATTLRFVALCGAEFDWGDKSKPEEDETQKAAEVVSPLEAVAVAEGAAVAVVAPEERTSAAWDDE